MAGVTLVVRDVLNQHEVLTSVTRYGEAYGFCPRCGTAFFLAGRTAPRICPNEPGLRRFTWRDR